MKLGSHVSMAGKGLLSAAQEAHSYGANTFMVYTGAPQNTIRKKIEDLYIEEGKAYMQEHGISEIIVHAPYIINLASPEKRTFKLAVDFLTREIERTEAIGSKHIILHPGSHVKTGEDVGLARIIEGLNEVIYKEQKVKITLELMAGKGTELNYDFNHTAAIFNGVIHGDKLAVCFDTCHVHDAGYDIINNFDGVLEEFDKIVGLDRLEVFHINGSLNPRGARKDRHANIGAGLDNPKGLDHIGYDALHYIVNHEFVKDKPCILETPWIDKNTNLYKEEIAMLKAEKSK
ncbi:deoxyribonuclease IV [Serpentinicella alkaliphila]|uniref:Probable endonuclease 4 n=1 Tax=Serpentinicella alkaliphila TaxID=1734049 RepID=A0A4R2TSD8_9FIRM|nr:deoxyribonuclease IV [Serpentinicella alkaliphila]QUH25658.1 deoxyribonuclease IV [Serpentinicella alkaliphila]TCQ06631.1 endonuclease IV [Serpentinicella alkaliphila]